MPLDLGTLLSNMVQLGASDLHIKSNVAPVYRLYGELMPTNHPPVTREEVAAALDRLIPPSLKHIFTEKGAVDFAFSLDANNRFRTNGYRQHGAYSIAIRRLTSGKLGFEDLGLPKVMENIGQFRRGMVLCVGPTGTGKTTTMAALIDYINANRREHIVTIEDPIEVLHPDKNSLIEQREIGIDCPNFEEGLRNALRQDPDVILVGEMRDRQTIAIGMQAAMTGHLLISTLHTTSSVHTINRIMQFYKHEELTALREDLAGALKAVISQRLIPAATGKARVPCVEVMIVNSMVVKLIRENRIDDIETVIKNGQEGMQSFDQSLADLTRVGRIKQEVAESFATDVQGFRRLVKGIKSGTDSAAILGGF